MKEATRVWCVGHRDGWCATDNAKRFRDSENTVKTACGMVVTMPFGCECRIPTCPECRGRRSL